jgi:electron transfer flavoprotein alpha subunit
MSLARNIWVIAEHSRGRLEDVSLEILSRARELADELGAEVSAAVVGSNSQELARALTSQGADKVYLLDSPLLLEYRAELYVEVLSKHWEDEKPEIVLCGATLIGRDLAARLAARLKTGLISECISLALNDEGLLLGTKLTHGGKVSSTLVCPASKPQMATVKPGVMAKARPDPTRKLEVMVITPQLSQKEPRTRVIGSLKADPKNISLDEAEVIVSGGKGAGSRENFRLVEELAKRLAGVVSGSLEAVDHGWLPRHKLVGQTGTSVAPKLYIACGISGSIYHVLGMRESKTIMAINKDRNAPIFKVADVIIVGDLSEIIPAINNQLDELSKGNTQVSPD